MTALGKARSASAAMTRATVFDIDASVTATLSGLNITGGSTPASGGGINNAGSLSLLDCTISGNSAFTGAGLYNSGTATLTSCTIIANTSSGRGAAGSMWQPRIWPAAPSPKPCCRRRRRDRGRDRWFREYRQRERRRSLQPRNATFTRLHAQWQHRRQRRRALFNYGDATLTASTVSANITGIAAGTAGIFDYAYKNPSISTVTLTDESSLETTPPVPTSAISPFLDGAAIVGSNNLLGPDGGLIFQNGVDGNVVLSNLSGLCLAPLGNYGGPTETMALLPGSAAIGAGVALSGVTTDQRGEPLDSPEPDIGAYQTQGFTITPAAGSTPQSVAAGDAFANPLAVTVTAIEPNQPVAGGIITYTVNPASNGASAKLSSAYRDHR